MDMALVASGEIDGKQRAIIRLRHWPAIFAFLLALLSVPSAFAGITTTTPATTPPAPAAGKRLALVIGNARYPTIPLNNPENDARVIASTLRRLGFEVIEHVNLGVREFRRVLREFARQMQNQPGTAVLYYAGHGVQIGGRNYLLPVDLNLRDEDEIKDDSIDLDDLFLSRIEKANTQVRIVILDACRDNPFRTTRGTHARRGLAEMAARGTLIAFSSAPGTTAEDGPPGTNSVYTRNLAKEMLVEGLEVEQLFKNVHVNVLRETDERQLTSVNNYLTASFSFYPLQGPSKEDVARQEAVHDLQARLERLEEEQKKLLERLKQEQKAEGEPSGPTKHRRQEAGTPSKQAGGQPAETAPSSPKQTTAPPSAPPASPPKQVSRSPSEQPAIPSKQAAARAPGQPSSPPKQTAGQPLEVPSTPSNQAARKTTSPPQTTKTVASAVVSRAPSERCVALLIRAQLGEPLSEAEMAYLRKECR